VIPAVIDRNIVVSALLSDRGHEASILALIMAEKLQPCLSPAILREYKDVLARPKFRFGLTQQNAILDLLAGKAIHVADTASPFSSPDPADT
jgi:putative PIN family toxin of toxin-antitoxin system